MGIDMRLHLVDGESLLNLLNMDWNEIISQMSNNTLRSSRPALDPKLNRDFDIDCEAEFLDIAENISGTGTVREVLLENFAFDALLKLVEWVSVGYWEAWEGRCFLYLENAIGRSMKDVEDMYSHSTWMELRDSLSGMSESEFSEKVCSDWMQRRKDLGETLDEKKDPRIIPTFESHDRNSRGLHYAVNQKQHVQILGRDHLDAKFWGHGDWNLDNLLNS
ncbi:MAG: hypothetical protein CMA11_04335 [Euryarchaeota archaeon]|nr:hypothetical protein [Euryarchaeota archaeon]